MTDLLPPRSFVFDYQSTSAVTWSDSTRTFVRDYSFDARNVIRAGAGLPSTALLDLLEVAFAAYFSDRLARRRDARDRSRGVQWRRHLTVRVGVRDVSLWNQPHVQTALAACLNFLTEDKWEFEFLPRRAPLWDVEQQSFLILPTTDAAAGVMLFSGGLDSFAGLATHIGDTHSEWVLVSGAPNPRHKGLQAAQVAAARHLTRRNVFHLTVPYSLAATVDAPVEERSQRARSFLFLTLGVVAAERVGADALLMCENGVGAINLPMDGTQVGTSNARAAHPTTLLRFNRLLASLIGDAVHVRNPFWDITKGEACRHDNLRELGHAITETVSCDSFPLRIPAMPQCGTCTSCLLRRVSLHAAGLQTFDTPSAYFRDVSRPNTPLRGKSLHPLQVMEWQFLRLRRALNARDPWNNLCQAFPELHSAAASYQQLESTPFSTVTQRLLRLYARYTDEWERFPGRQHLATSIAA
jgi:7-cyano-7-deazaguanine synthase in queuosine biosynthesis